MFTAALIWWQSAQNWWQDAHDIRLGYEARGTREIYDNVAMFYSHSQVFEGLGLYVHKKVSRWFSPLAD